MPSPVDYPDNHPGWERLMVGMAEIMGNHPFGHECRVCREADRDERRDRVQRNKRRDRLRLLAAEIVETYRDSEHPAIRTIIRHLQIGLGQGR